MSGNSKPSQILRAGLLVFALAQPALGQGLDLRGMDTSAKPCQDVWKFANGNWLKRNSIPSDRAAWGVDTEVEERNLALLHQILDDAARNKAAAPESPAGKVGAFYRSGMDEAQIDRDGAKPLDTEFARIAAVTTIPELQAEVAHLHQLGIGAAFSFSVDQDAKDSNREMAQLYQGGLSLPDRDYYLSDEPDKAKIRPLYLAHVAKMLQLLGDTPDMAKREAQTVMGLETRLAKASMTPVEQRDPQAIYHKKTVAELNALTPAIKWEPYFTALGLDAPGDLNVAQPVFFAEVGKILSDTPFSDWKTYLRWHLLRAEAGDLSKPFAEENFHFYSTTLNGIKQMKPRWKRMEEATDSELGEALGQIYVAKAFGPQAKARALALVGNLKAALQDDIETLTWMGPDTKKAALAKLDALHIKIGYPDTWRDYAKLAINSPSYVVNVMAADRFEFQRNLAKLGKPVDRTEWGMTPPTVNAYYNAQMNEIVFPAGILQPPYFDPQADDAVNYGEIGATIGHEMTHGFDDEGRQYDAQGNLTDWWTADDVKNFTSRADQIVTQYAAFVPLPKTPINGKLTLGENIADIGGLKIAYLAFEKAIKDKPRTKIDGYTPEQRFFIAYAQSWREKTRPESLRVRLTTDPHSPEEYRVLGPLRAMPEFYAAFGCSQDRAGVSASGQIW